MYQFHTPRGHVAHDARCLSSGTLATLTGERRYERLDQVQVIFVARVDVATRQFESWVEAWLELMPEYIQA